MDVFGETSCFLTWFWFDRRSLRWAVIGRFKHLAFGKKPVKRLIIFRIIESWVQQVKISYHTTYCNQHSMSQKISPDDGLLCGGALYTGNYSNLWCQQIYRFVSMKRWAISFFKVPSYLEAFAKELRSTYPGISFFTRYTVHCALYIVQCVQCTAYMVHMKSFSLCETLIGFVQFVLPVKSGWRMPQTNKCLKQTPLQI